MRNLVLVALSVFIVGCATQDPTLARQVERKGQGIYKATSVGVVDGLDEAVKQCQMDGNKKLDIITTTTEYDYVLKQDLSVYVFKCVENS